MDTRSACRLALLGPLLAGCAGIATPPAPPPTAAEFETMREVLASSPEARAAISAQCRDDVARKSADERAMLGALLDLDADEVALGFCERTLAGITRGDVTYADFVAMTEGSDDPQLLRRFIRALRLDPSAVAI
jgi:hypothetical protein